VHDEQVCICYGGIGLTGDRRRHHAAVAGEPARAAAEAAHSHALLNAYTFAASVVEGKNRCGKRLRKILHRSVEAAKGRIVGQADIADSHRRLLPAPDRVCP
jgi:hypothetical protein